MLKNKYAKKILGGFLVVNMIFAVGATASGAAYRSPEEKVETQKKMHKHSGGLKNIIEKLVEEGSITKEKGSTINQYIDKKFEEMRTTPGENKGKYNILKDMKENNIINDTEEKLIRDKFIKMREERFEKKLGELLERKVLTEKNVKDIKNYIKEYSQKKEAEFAKLKGQSEEEQRAQLKKMKEAWKNPFDEMVERKIITKAQKDEIMKSIQHEKHHEHLEHKYENKGEMNQPRDNNKEE